MDILPPKMYILAPEMDISAPKMYIFTLKMDILAREMYLLAPKMDTLTPKMYILAPKMEKKCTFWKGTAPVTAFVPFFLRVLSERELIQPDNGQVPN